MNFSYIYYFLHQEISIIEIQKDLPGETSSGEKYQWLVISNAANMVWPLSFQAMSEAGKKQFRTFAEAELSFDENEAVVILMGREFKFERKDPKDIPLDLEQKVKKYFNV